MRTRSEKNKFLNELRELPIVSVVCKRTGISKATIYRWLKNDAGFKNKFNDCLSAGRENVTDLAESQLIAQIKKGEPWAIRQWLENNNKRYIKPRAPLPPHSDYKGVTQFNITLVDGKKKTYYSKDPKPDNDSSP